MPYRPSLAPSLRPSSREDVDVTGCYVADEVQSLSSEADVVGDVVHSDPSETVEGDSVEVPSAAPSASAVVRSAAYCRGIRCQCLGALAF